MKGSRPKICHPPRLIALINAIGENAYLTVEFRTVRRSDARQLCSKSNTEDFQNKSTNTNNKTAPNTQLPRRGSRERLRHTHSTPQRDGHSRQTQ